jgi:hypothetical protein
MYLLETCGRLAKTLYGELFGMTQTLTAATAKILLGNIAVDDTDIETLIFKSIGDLELQGAPTLPTATGSSGSYSWSLANNQFAAVINVLKENYATIYVSASSSSGSSSGIGLGSLSMSSSQSSSSSNSSGGSKVVDVAKQNAMRLITRQTLRA